MKFSSVTRYSLTRMLSLAERSSEAWDDAALQGCRRGAATNSIAMLANLSNLVTKANLSNHTAKMERSRKAFTTPFLVLSMPDKSGGLKGSMQHWLAVYPLECEIP